MNEATLPASRPLGYVVGGSLSKGLQIRLDPSASVEDIKVGTFVVVRGERGRYFALVSDIGLESADPRLPLAVGDLSDPLLAEAVAGTTAYGVLTVVPQLVLPPVRMPGVQPAPAKTVPGHFAPVFPATEQDVAQVFGQEDEHHFWIGSPMDMETRLCLDLPTFVQRSNGVFGKSGSGKSFLTRLLLVGILQSDLASCLVFDMHNEYGWSARDPERGIEVKGLKQLFPSRVVIFSLDPESSRRRGIQPDFEVEVGFEEVQPADLELLRETLALSDPMLQCAYALEDRFGRKWLARFLETKGEEVSDLARQMGVNATSLQALRQRMAYLTRFPFLRPEVRRDAVEQVLLYLDRGMSVVLEFGRYKDDLTAYILVANLLTRRIHEQYVRRTEEALGDTARHPRPLVIVIEEAHRFLKPGIGNQTAFGTIAREMRKYQVTLLVVDQRPSQIDTEVLSQVGTKVVCLLDDERDVEAVLSGAPGARALRTVLTRLESKQQALIFGHAVPIPVVVRVREYGSPESYEQITRRARASPPADGPAPLDLDDPFA